MRDEKSEAADEETDKEDADVYDVAPSPSWICGAGQRMSVSERAERLSRLISDRQCRCSRYEKETNAVMQSMEPMAQILSSPALSFLITIDCYSLTTIDLITSGIEFKGALLVSWWLQLIQAPIIPANYPMFCSLFTQLSWK